MKKKKLVCQEWTVMFDGDIKHSKEIIDSKELTENKKMKG